MNNEKFTQLMAYIMIVAIVLIMVALATKTILWIFGL